MNYLDRGRQVIFRCALTVSLLLFSYTVYAEQSTKVATYAGGCFWCTESDFDKVPGVLSTVSGYIGGRTTNPTYKEVSSGVTGHIEAVQITYDPKVVTYQELLEVYWKSIDPSVANRQFCDVGPQYRSAIFYHNTEQEGQARASKQKLIDSQRFERVYTEIINATVFYPAEEYHQDYYLKNPNQYRFYRWRCGRDARLEEIWG